MPNWCSNRVQIGTKNGINEEDINTLKELVEAVKGRATARHASNTAPYGTGADETVQSPFSFNSIIPMPENIRNTTSPNKILATKKEVDAYNEEQKDNDFFSPANTKRQVTALEKKYGAPNWYEWSIKNWGTKWDLPYGEVQADETFLDDGEITYRFETAWSPPEPIYRELRDQYPNLRISWHYDEPGMEFSGYL